MSEQEESGPIQDATPGPWEPWWNGDEWIVSSKVEDHPAWQHDKYGGTHNVAACIARPANARLIAAAPSLLEMLLSLQWGWDSDEGEDDGTCLVCDGIHPEHGGSGHRPGCKLAAVIAKALTD